MAVMMRVNDLKEIGEGHERLALQGPANRIDLRARQGGQIRQGAFANVRAFPVGLPQQDRRRRIAVRHNVDVHGYIMHISKATVNTIHGYKMHGTSSLSL